MSQKDNCQLRTSQEIGILKFDLHLVDPDGNVLYDSGNAPFAGLNFQTYVYYSDFDACFISSTYESGNDCDDNNAALNGFDEDGDGVSSCDGDCDDQDASLNLLDEDGDGITSCGGDCNDLDDQIAVDTDKDGDGYLGMYRRL